MKILVRPCYPVGLKNKLFEPGDVRANHHKSPYVQWKQEAKKQDIEIDTWDMYPLSEADLIIFQDIPQSKKEIIETKLAAPKVPLILLLYESPLDRTHFYEVKNHYLFDAVITFNYHLCDEKKYFQYYLPVGIPDAIPAFKAFQERKNVVMVNTNTYSGILAQRKSGLSGLPLIGPYLCGWKIPLHEVIYQHQNNLYQRRRKVARLAGKYFPNLLDIYGYGWQGEATSWIHKLIPNKPFIGALGRTAFSKLETLSRYRFCLAFENIFGDYGYISEKIFDCFYAGVVPIYLGDENITSICPEEAFIDARHFKNDLELLQYVKNCSESNWYKMYESGQKFLASESIDRFQTKAFVQRILGIINTVMKNYEY